MLFAEKSGPAGSKPTIVFTSPRVLAPILPVLKVLDMKLS